MIFNVIYKSVKKIRASGWVIAFYILFIPLVNTNHHNWKQTEGMITWDIKSYYAYLPAAFIYHDLSLDFIQENPEKFGKWIWPINTPTGKRGIITSMGLSFMYAPFFAIAHTVATLNPIFDADGYSFPYHYALAFSTFFYFILGLFVLRKILWKYYSDKITAITLLAIGLGTNLFFYITYSAPMPHGYNFVLITIFVFYLIKWHESYSIKNTIALGLLSGLIALIRPTNILVLTLIPLWNVYSINSFKESIYDLAKKWPLILLMATCFILIWVPQFAYWKYISGKFFYFSYGEEGGKFFWSNPQIFNVLLSYKKGWYLYTPMMLLATTGIYLLYKQTKTQSIAILIYLVLSVYVISSWWCWWFGGSFGQRSMIDLYGVMALPFAAFVSFIDTKKFWRYPAIALIFILIFFNLFQIKQLNNQALHYWWMNSEAYWENFMKLKPTCKYWKVILIPDYDKARQGIYVSKPPFDRNAVVSDVQLKNKIIEKTLLNPYKIDSLTTLASLNNLSLDSTLNGYATHLIENKEAKFYYDEIKIEYYIDFINNCRAWKEEIEKEAQRKNITYNSMAIIEANRVFNLYSDKYDKQ